MPDVHGYLEQHYPPRVIGWVKGMKWRRKRVPLARIQMQSRPGKPHDPGKVAGIRKAIRKGKPMKPVVLVDTGTGLAQDRGRVSPDEGSADGGPHRRGRVHCADPEAAWPVVKGHA